MEKNDIFKKLDYETLNHSIRVADLTVLIARKMNLKNLDEIYEIAKFHDIGKINIDSTILCKPTSLSNDEFKIVKQHPNFGVQILKNLFTNDELIQILYHHENIDGSGYYGLKKDEIPLISKIIRIADVYDALISTRCYKHAYSKNETLMIMNKDINKIFDKNIYNVFLSIIKKKL